jgi:hypothetical protein
VAETNAETHLQCKSDIGPWFADTSNSREVKEIFILFEALSKKYIIEKLESLRAVFYLHFAEPGCFWLFRQTIEFHSALHSHVSIEMREANFDKFFWIQ